MRTPILLILGAVGCSGTAEPNYDDLSDWSEGYESTDTVDTNSAGAYLRITTPSGLNYETITHPEGDWVSECLIETDGYLSGFKQQTCYIEVQELDLYGTEFQFGFEASGCGFISWSHYMYEAWETSPGEVDVSYSVAADGTIFDEVNSYDGLPYCASNYSYWNGDHPNCCVGTYNLTITDYRDDPKGVVGSYPGLQWGGNPAYCYSGAAYTDPDAIFNEEGWPMDHIVLLNKAYYSKNFKWDALSEGFFTNLNLSNYYDPDDHDGSMPAGIAGDYAQPYYSITCLDHAEEELARIDVVVREWNEAAQYELEEIGDPNTEGVEAKSGSPLNDRLDWKDATPGSVLYVRWAQ